jgi:hypothetical protein
MEEQTPHPSFGQVFKFWLKLGFISFGGPTGQISILVWTFCWIDFFRGHAMGQDRHHSYNPGRWRDGLDLEFPDDLILMKSGVIRPGQTD